ncbi:MAG: tRNA pseudouridine(65) synthase TruC [Gammaproteobacteria bacterium]
MLKVLYRDDCLVAIDKPAGLLVHRSNIDRHETRFAIQLLRDQLGCRVFPVHRLDKPTAGVLLFALDAETAKAMMEVFAGESVAKSYMAVVRGFTEPEGVIDYPLHEQLDKMTDARALSDKPAQDAVTHYQRLGTVELPIPVGRYPTSRYSLLRLIPKTGRKHQLRRHLKHIFHPIVGDTTHGDGRHNALFRGHFDCWRLLLAARSLGFVHPVTGVSTVIEAPLDAEFARVLLALGWRLDF